MTSRLVWQFAGQGKLRVGSARELYESDDAFRRALGLCDAILKPRLGVGASELLYPEISGHLSHDQAEQMLQETRYAQAVLVSLEYSMSELWTAQGLRPWAVLGHSLGEYTAAVVADVMSLEDCLTLVCERGRLMQDTAGCQGCMFALRASASAAERAIA